MVTLRWFQNLRIRYKLFITYSAVLLVTVGVGTMVLDAYVRESIRQNAESELANSAELVINMVKTAAAVSVKNHLRATAEDNREIVRYYHQQSVSGRMSEEEAKAAVGAVLLSQRVGKTGYLFVWDIRNAPESIPLAIHPKIQGQDVSNVDFVQEGARLKNGYLEYRWRNPGEDTEREKAMYLAYFEPWQWIIAASSYKEEFVELVNVDDFRDNILSIRVGHTGYFFVIDSSGNIVIHPALKGNYFDATDSHGQLFIQKICSLKRGQLTYSWKNPGEASYREKLASFGYLPEYDWIVASSGYKDEFEAPLQATRGIVLLTSGMAVLLILVISFIIGAIINRPMQELVHAFEQDAKDLSARLPVKSLDEIGRLSLHFNRFMGRLESESRERSAAEHALRESEARLLTLINATPDIICFKDARGAWLLANTSILDLYQLKEVDYRNKTEDELADYTAPIYENAFGTCTDTDETAWNRGSLSRSVEIIPDISGQNRTYDVIKIPLYNLDGSRKGLMVFGRDMTEFKRAEEEIRDREQKYRVLFESAHDAIFLQEPSGNFLDCNENGAQMLGLSKESIIGRSPADFSPERQPDGRLSSEVAQEKLRAACAGHPQHFEFQVLHAEGGTLDVEISLNRFEMGGSFLLQSIIRDITERKLAEDALRESEQRYRAFFEEGPDGVVILDPETGRFVEFNDQVCRQLGFTRDEFARLHVSDIEACETADEILTRFQKVLRDGRDDFETRQRTKHGEIRIVQVTAQVIDSGRSSIYHCIWRDITERKQAEEALRESEKRLRSIIDAVPFGAHLYELDKHDRLVFRGYNRSADRILGVDHSQFLGKTIEEAFPPLRETEIPERYKQVAAEGDLYETEHIDYDHSAICGAFEVHGFQTSPRWMAAFFADITERKRMEAERERLQAQLIQAQKMESVGRLAGGVAHDFNNKIQAIFGYTSLALTEVQPDSIVHQWLQEIEKAAQQSADLTRQLLAFARKQTARLQVLNLNETISRMLSMLRRIVGEEIEFQWTGGSALWSIKMDPAQIDQIVVNLVVNSRDAISGTGQISLSTQNTVLDDFFCAAHPGATPGDYVLLSVKDNGAGMSREMMGNIFEPFFTTKELGKGTGLGLSTVYGIVKQNAGFIDVESEPGMGTTFYVYLPKHEGKEIQPEEEHAATHPVLGTETILIVEDEEAILNLAKAILQQLGYHVLSAQKPVEAINMAGKYEGDIHLLISDVVMPEMNGRELAKRLTLSRPCMKCLFMSGHTADVIAHHGILDHGVEFIQKPFSVSKFSEMVRRVLEG